MNEDASDFEEDDFQEAITRFNEMVDNNTSNYFDVFEIEGIVDYFLEEGEISLAKKAVESGLEMHPDAISI
ncbi:MAG TPA: hypothetical protein DCL77_08265, partial [Prolixibacteraceae bacterium]|nr:hypothetical protein [Prolixibacteraceae bacterium]